MAKPLGTSVVVKQPWIEVRNSIETVGVRKVIPTKIVAGEITRSLIAVKSAVEQLGLRQIGRPFFRFHAITMGVTYDIEIGYLLLGPLLQAPGLVPGRLPAGTYACLRYLGKNRGYQGNKLSWIGLGRQAIRRISGTATLAIHLPVDMRCTFRTSRMSRTTRSG